MTELAELYQQVILDHNRSPRNFRVIDNADRTAHGDNPLCGDKITVYVKLKDETIEDVSFQGSGCAISQASASLMTASLRGKSLAQVEEIFNRFHAMVTGSPRAPAEQVGLGKLAVFAGVREFPARVKCANLAWHTVHAALEARSEPVTTE